MSHDVDIEGFLRQEGFHAPAAQERARGVLEAQGLTRAGKRRISAAKLAPARRALSDALVGVCGNPECERLSRPAAGDGREPVRVAPTACAVCAGSNNRRAVVALAGCLRAQGVDRVLVVGGTPAQHADMEGLLRERGIQLRCVDGARGSHSKSDAAPDLEWAQLLLVWGATPLPHKVSRLYTTDPPSHLRTVKLAKRGVEALCREAIRSFE